jgi:hypothetical protein
VRLGIVVRFWDSFKINRMFVIFCEFNEQQKVFGHGNLALP